MYTKGSKVRVLAVYPEAYAWKYKDGYTRIHAKSVDTDIGMGKGAINAWKNAAAKLETQPTEALDTLTIMCHTV